MEAKLTDSVLQAVVEAVGSQPRGLVGPQPKGANPGLSWVARVVKRLAGAVEDGVWKPREFRLAMIEVAACAVAAAQWTERHYLQRDNYDDE